jgi:hypothetical protein
LKDNDSHQSYGRILSSIAAVASVKELPLFVIHEPAGFLAASMLVYCSLANIAIGLHCQLDNAIITEVMMAVAVAPAIKEVGHLSSCFVLLDLCYHLSFQSQMKLEAVLMVDTRVLLALIPRQETMTALHLVHCTITT